MTRSRTPSPTGTMFSPPNRLSLDAQVEQVIAPMPAIHLADDDIDDYQDSPIRLPQPTFDDDIYRGATGAPPDRPPSPMLSVYAQSSVSSVSSGGRGRRRGALATLVEAAIARWGRASSDASSSTSSSSSSSSSSASNSRRRSRRRKGSVTTTQTLTKTPAERAKAREEIKVTKRVPREFSLFLPQSLCPPDGLATKPNARPAPKPLAQPTATKQRMLQTRHIKLILVQLEAALKKNARELRAADRQKSRQLAKLQPDDPSSAPAALDTRKIPRLVVEVPTPDQTPKPGLADLREPTDQSSTPVEKPQAASLGLTGLEVPARTLPKQNGNISSVIASVTGNRAWWLDVASPTWEDMRAIGKLLHLHPLTLEDILHEDPREKLELFPRLGYYFVVFRALETQAALRKPRPPDAEQEGTVGAVNVYFVIFREGIVTFHFEDISDHADRVRQKIIEFEETIQMSSDWIAHGLMDSMVDAFVPIIRKIDKEVEGVDALITNPQSSLESVPPSEVTIVGSSSDVIEKKVEELEKAENSASTSSSRTGMLSRLRTWKRRLRSRMWLLLPKRVRCRWGEKEPIVEPPTKLATFQTLLRMANTRRLVTSLGRLLATKSEVIGQLRKRLQATAWNVVDWDEGDMAGGQEVGIYLGDVQDHILTMQQSLNHYERILSHDHPAYLAHLRLLLSEAKGGKDKMILMLSVVIFTVPVMQWPIGLGSMNIHLPNQKDTPYYTYWFIWLGSTVVVMLCVFALVWWWWVQAKRRRKANRLI